MIKTQGIAWVCRLPAISGLDNSIVNGMESVFYTLVLIVSRCLKAPEELCSFIVATTTTRVTRCFEPQALYI